MGEDEERYKYYRYQNPDYINYIRSLGARVNIFGNYDKGWFHPNYISKFEKTRVKTAGTPIEQKKSNGAIDLGREYINSVNPSLTPKQKSIATPLFNRRTSNLLDLGNNQGYAVNGYQDNANAALNGYKSVSDLQTFLNGLIDSGVLKGINKLSTDNKFGKNTDAAVRAYNEYRLNNPETTVRQQTTPQQAGGNPQNKYDYITNLTNDTQTPSILTALQNGKLKTTDIAKNMQWSDELNNILGQDWQSKYNFGNTLGKRDTRKIQKIYNQRLADDNTALQNFNYLAKDGFTKDEISRLSGNKFLEGITFDEDPNNSNTFLARKTPGKSNYQDILNSTTTKPVAEQTTPGILPGGFKKATINSAQINPINEIQEINQDVLNKNKYKGLKLESAKKGNKIMNKYQEGGDMAPQQDDMQSQIIQLVQAAMQGDEQAAQQIEQIMQAAQQGDQQAAQIAQMIQEVIQQMQGQSAQAAKQGAKLNYIKRLRGECKPDEELVYFKSGGQVCKKCQKKAIKKACGGKKMFRAGGTLLMNDILTEIYAKGGGLHTAFGGKVSNPEGRYGGRKAFNPNGTHQLDQHSKPNKFTAFGDEGRKKPTNSGLTGHHATGKAGRMQNKQSAGTTYKATAFGGDKQKKYHKGTGGVPRSGLRTIPRYPKGHGGKTGIGRM